MAKLFNVRRPSGKLAAQHETRELAEREIGWLLASNSSGPFTIEEIERKPAFGYSIGSPSRSGTKWPKAKNDEFRERYARGEKIADLTSYFGSGLSSVCSRARKLGFVHRIDSPDYFEKHRGRWTSREEELINALYDEATSIRGISENIPRTQWAITKRLNSSAPILSVRSKYGRFIIKPGTGHRGISPVLEETCEFNDDRQ